METRGACCRHRYTIEAAGGVKDLLGLAGEAAGERAPLFYWEHPDSGEAILACGAAHAVFASGPHRLAEAERSALEVLAGMQSDGVGSAGVPGPRFVGGFGFGPEDTAAPMWREFPACALFLPARMWLLKDGRCWSIEVEPCDAAAWRKLAVPARAAEDPEARDDRPRWLGRVRRSLELVGRGRLAKVVMSRRRQWTLPRRFSAVPVLRRLRAERPACFTFWMSGGETHFIGSTPELLVRCDGDTFETQALAGTMARGADVRGDAARSAELLGSAKNRLEHRLVIRGIEEALRPLTVSLEVPETPGLLALPEAYHLRTPIRGTLRRPAGVLAVADRLHPTAAVCGAPREAARRLIDLEEADRGWYTGAVGWLDAAGNGAFSVALRAALIDGSRVNVWAGAGIVAGSDPDSEFDETDLKMQALMDAMEAGGMAADAGLGRAAGLDG